jgi:hypothetical protein
MDKPKPKSIVSDIIDEMISLTQNQSPDRTYKMN